MVQLFNSSEKRLARALLLLARYGRKTKPRHVVTKISQETLSEMVGTTRATRELLHEKIQETGLHRGRRQPRRGNSDR